MIMQEGIPQLDNPYILITVVVVLIVIGVLVRLSKRK